MISSLLLVLLAPATLADRIIHKEKSLYRNIVVKERRGQRCLQFSVKREQRNQTCMDLKDPDRIVFPYVRMSLAGLLLNPSPKRLLMIGLGGGTISNVLAELYPDMEMDLVEVDQAVVNVAREYFELIESDRIKVHTIDGRVFTRRAARRGQQYDMVILDAFTGDYIPEHLMTVEFLRDVGAVLAADGVVVANTFATSRLYDYESATYQAAFGNFLNLKLSGTGNRVIVASAAALPDNRSLMQTANLLTHKLEHYGVNLIQYVSRFKREPDWSAEVLPLTDQFAPANLLRGD